MFIVGDIPNTEAKILKGAIQSSATGNQRLAFSNVEYPSALSFEALQCVATNTREGVFRGFHINLATMSARIVQCIYGHVIYFWADMRRGSPHFAVVHMLPISGDSGQQLFLPSGFLLGFYSLRNNSICLTSSDSTDHEQDETSIRFDDAVLTGHTPEMLVFLSQRSSQSGAISEKDNRRTKSLSLLLQDLPEY